MTDLPATKPRRKRKPKLRAADFMTPEQRQELIEYDAIIAREHSPLHCQYWPGGKRRKAEWE